MGFILYCFTDDSSAYFTSFSFVLGIKNGTAQNGEKRTIFPSSSSMLLVCSVHSSASVSGKKGQFLFSLVLVVLVYSFFSHILFSPFCAGMQFDHDFLVIIAVAITFQFCFNNIIICNQKNVVND